MVSVTVLRFVFKHVIGDCDSITLLFKHQNLKENQFLLRECGWKKEEEEQQF